MQRKEASVRRSFETLAGISLCVALAWGGALLANWAGLPVPGAVLGMAVYVLLLASGRGDWSLGGADLLNRLIGAMIVPALVGLGAFGRELLPALGPLAVVLVGSTVVTAVVTAGLFRLAGGRD